MEEGVYLATLRVSSSLPGSEERLDGSAETTVAVGAPVLEVEDEDSQTLLASSTEAAEETAIVGGGAGTAAGGGVSSESPLALAEVELSLDKPNNSFLLRGAGQSKQVTVRLKKVPGQLQTVEVEATLSSSQTDGRANVVLHKTGTSRGLSTFEGTLALVVGTPVPGTQNKIFLEEKRDSFTLFDMSGDGVHLQDSQEYQSWRLALRENQYGWARDSADTMGAARRKQFQYDAPCSADAFRAAGYQTLLVTYPQGSRPPRRCWLRLKNQATSLYYSGEGYHDYGIRLDFARVFVRPQNGSFLPFPDPEHADYKSVTFSPDDWNDGLKTVILAGCSVLDVGNFNDYRGFGTANPAPGRAFYESVTPGSLLLGYNAKAPFGGAPHPLYPFPLDEINTDTKILIDYQKFLAGQREDRNGNPIVGLTRPMAWLLANASNADRACDDACALENDYYYFIKFTTNWKDSDARNTDRAVYRVYRLYWTSIGSKLFDDIPVSPFGKELLRKLPNAKKGDVNAI
ncbi:MAG: hypothetical protein AMXMBFR33_20890 [Candidatus Xenobia bacterium]